MNDILGFIDEYLDNNQELRISKSQPNTTYTTFRLSDYTYNSVLSIEAEIDTDSDTLHLVALLNRMKKKLKRYA
jgi:hypothetical protein